MRQIYRSFWSCLKSPNCISYLHKPKTTKALRHIALPKTTYYGRNQHAWGRLESDGDQSWSEDLDPQGSFRNPRVRFGQISLKTFGDSRDLNFNPICKCHTILETSWYLGSPSQLQSSQEESFLKLKLFLTFYNTQESCHCFEALLSQKKVLVDRCIWNPQINVLWGCSKINFK